MTFPEAPRAKAPGRRTGAALSRTLLQKTGLADRLDDVLAGILEVSSEGVIVADSRGRILLFSKGAEAMFGYSAEDLAGQPLEILMPREHRQQHKGHVRRFAAGPARSRRMSARRHVTGRRKDGTVFPLEVGLSKVGPRNGQIFTAILRDMSEQKRAELAFAQAAERANAANQAKSAFLATMSHEIRTPLNGVLGMAQAMAMEDLPPHQRSRLDIIRQSGESLLAILNDLLDLSKIEAGKLALEEAEFEMDQLATAALRTFSAVAAEKRLNFTLRVADSARGLYRGDPLRIRQILHNLISNALKFTERGGVQVSLTRRRGVLSLVVKDTGIGIPADMADRLFEKFEQGDATTTRRYGGTGLGLPIIRDLTAMMGGSIKVASVEGGGAAFTVLLPLVRLDKSPAPHPGDAVAEPTHLDAGLRVLVAEDNGVNQLVLRTLLNQVGIEPTIVADGLAAVSAWERASWDVILMDVQMPAMDGPTAAALIRRREASDGLPRTPIIALTANAMEHQAAEYRRAGMDDLVAKPIQLDKLLGAIATWTED